MTTERAPEWAFPSGLEHKHGIDEWWPMLPERSAETVEPGADPRERTYRCQKIGCLEMVRIAAGVLPESGREAVEAGR